METIGIHHHPKMEKEIGIDAGHVIIDENLYIAIMRKYGDCFKTESPPPKSSRRNDHCMRLGDYPPRQTAAQSKNTGCFMIFNHRSKARSPVLR